MIVFADKVERGRLNIPAVFCDSEGIDNIFLQLKVAGVTLRRGVVAKDIGRRSLLASADVAVEYGDNRMAGPAHIVNQRLARVAEHLRYALCCTH